jgi:hypothetical protein
LVHLGLQELKEHVCELETSRPLYPTAEKSMDFFGDIHDFKID